MKKFLKWTLIVVLTLVVIVAISAFVITSKAEKKFTKTYDDVKPTSISIPTDTASLVRGQHLSNHCTHCHGNDFAGTAFFDDKDMGSVPAPNITGGKGSPVATYTDMDWIRSIRHGLRKDGTPLFIMPSNEFHHFTAEELGSLIAFLKNVPKVDKEWTKPNLSFMGKLILGMNGFGEVFSAETINHSEPIVPSIKPEINAVYGEHLALTGGCKTCHGAALNGAKSPDPNAPFSPNLTMGGNLGKWSVDDFMKTLRTGETPEGKNLDDKFMPWSGIGKMTDNELSALFLYLKSQPKLETTKS